MNGLRTWAAVAAAGLAAASAAVSLYWTLGGTALLDTVGGAVEELARSRSPAALVLGWLAVVCKVVAALLALGLTRSPSRAAWRRMIMLPNALASGLLVVWGGANVVVGSLVLSGAVHPATVPDRRALWWHVVVWDLWFLVWGLLLAVAVVAFWRACPLGGRSDPHPDTPRDAGLH